MKEKYVGLAAGASIASRDKIVSPARRDTFLLRVSAVANSGLRFPPQRFTTNPSTGFCSYWMNAGNLDAHSEPASKWAFAGPANSGADPEIPHGPILVAGKLPAFFPWVVAFKTQTAPLPVGNGVAPCSNDARENLVSFVDGHVSGKIKESTGTSRFSEHPAPRSSGRLYDYPMELPKLAWILVCGQNKNWFQVRPRGRSPIPPGGGRFISRTRRA